MKCVRPTFFKSKKQKNETKRKEIFRMSQTTITLLFLTFTIISFILEKIPLGLTATICALGLTLTGVLDASTTFAQYVNSNVILCVGMFVVIMTVNGLLQPVLQDSLM